MEGGKEYLVGGAELFLDGLEHVAEVALDALLGDDQAEELGLVLDGDPLAHLLEGSKERLGDDVRMEGSERRRTFLFASSARAISARENALDWRAKITCSFCFSIFLTSLASDSGWFRAKKCATDMGSRRASRSSQAEAAAR